MAQIQIWTRDVQGTSTLGGYAPQHTFFIKINDDGTRELLRGGPHNDSMVTGEINIIRSSYNSSSLDWYDPSSSSNPLNYQGKTVKTASQAEIDSLWDSAWNDAQNMNSEVYDYEPLTQNCNTSVGLMADAMGLRNEVSNFIEEVDVWTPGFEKTFNHSVADKAWDIASELGDKIDAGFEAIGSWIEDFKNSREFGDPNLASEFNINYSSVLDGKFRSYLKQAIEEELQQSLTDQAFDELLLGKKYSDILKYSEAVKEIASKNSGSIENIDIDTEQDATKVTVNNTSYEISQGDQKQLIEILGISPENATFIDAEGNVIATNDAIFVKTDSAGNKITVKKEGAKISTKDGGSHAINSVVNQADAQVQNIAKFAADQTKEFTDGFQDYLVQSKERILADFIARMTLGQSAEEAMKAVVEVWSVNAVFNNQYTDGLFSDMFGIKPIPVLDENGNMIGGIDYSGNGLAPGEYAIDPNTNQVLVDANGEPVTFRSDQGDITHNEAMGGVKAGVVSFLTTVLIAELRGGGMDSEQYSEAAIKAAGVGVMTAMLPSGTPVGALMAIIDSSIVAFEEIGDFNSEDWQDLTTHTAAAVAAAVIGWKIGATIGTAIGGPIGTVVGGVIGAVVGALLYVPLKNLFDTQFEASEELYDAIEDTLIKMDWSANNVEENAKQAIKAVEDIAKAYLIDLPLDYYTGLFNLLSGGSFYSGQTFGPGEYGDPSLITRQLYEIRQKADGTGLEIIGVGREGVTLKASQNGVDNIYGSAHSDVMVGNDQNNIIIGSSSSENGADNDMIEGKGGDDVLLGNAGHDHIDGGDGDDQIDGGVGNDRLIAGAGDDIVIGDEGDDIIEGNEGDDQIDSGAGDDIVDGGSGDDTIVSGTGHDQIDSGDGKDIIFSESGDDLIRAGAGDDNIDSGEGNDEVYGQDGEDNINTGLGDDIVFAGAGVDTVNSGLGNDIIDAGSDDDLVLAGIGHDIVYGNSGNDDLYGEIGNDYIMGGTGDDEIGGGEGDDILIGNAGNDTLDGGAGNDLFIHNLGDGNTEITDESGSDIIRIFGVADQNNISFAKNGNDLEVTFSENAGDKITIKDQFLDSDVRVESLRIDNNTEIDLASLAFDVEQNATYNTSYYSDAIDESELAEKYQNILEDSNNEVVYNSYSSWYADNYDTNVLTQEIDYEQYNEAQIRSYKAKRGAFGGHYMVYYKYYESNLGGTFGNDKIVGSWWNENIFGGDGNDYLYGNDGNDTIFGGDDHDLIYLGSGNDNGYGQNGFDKIYGGQGNDTIEGNADNDTLYGEHGNDVIMGRSGDDLAFGGKGNDFLKGGTGHDILFGGDNSDNIEGEDGNDYLLGEKGDDIISGGSGDDTIVGGDGNDILNGNSGNDTIKGGNGLDIIDGGEGNDIINAGAGNDMIIDSKGNDQITLGDGKDIYMLDTSNGGTKTITDFNSNEDRIILKNITTDLATLIANNQIIQDGTNVRFIHNSYSLILENTSLEDLSQDNFITSIIGDEFNNILNGDEYANAIFGLGGDDILNGNGGDDLLWGGSGSDQLYGNAGDDILYYNIDSYWQGSRQVAGKWNVINRTPSTVNADSGDVANLDDHTASQDLFDGGDGDDILIMSEQDDTILLDSALTQVEQFNNTHFEENNENGFGGAPIDIETIYAFGGDDIINLSSDTNSYGDVRIYGDSGNDTIWSNQGNDSLFGGDGNDNIQAGAGDDVVYGESDDDTIHGQDGNDNLYGNDGNDSIYGGAGEDNLFGGDGNDYLNGGIGNDTYIFNIGDGHDTIKDEGNGNDQKDTIVFGESISRENLSLARLEYDLVISFKDNADDSITIQSFFSDGRYNEVEFLRFSDGTELDIRNTIFADVSDSESLYGTDHSDDIINGFEGNDRIYGNAGDDTLSGGEGNDVIFTGEGDDHADGGNGNDSITSIYGSDTIYGGNGDDTIITNSDAKTINGGEGNDRINFSYSSLALNFDINSQTASFADGTSYQTESIESVVGTSQNDIIIGDSGDNIIEGGEGDDILTTGQGGNDILTGGQGSDSYIVNQKTSAENDTTITDFDIRNGDIINIESFVDGVAYENLNIYQNQKDTHIELSDSQTIILQNTRKEDLSYRNFQIQTTKISGTSNNDII